MTKRLLVGIGTVEEGSEHERYLQQVLTSLGALGVEVQVAAFAPRPAPDALARVADVRHLAPLRHGSPASVAQAAIRRASPALGGSVQDLRTRRGRRRLAPPDCVHISGSAGAPLLYYVRTLDVPVTVYLPPGDHGIAWMHPRDRYHLVTRPDRFLPADPAVARSLLTAQVDPDRVEPAPAEDLVVAPLTVAETRARERRALDLPRGRPVVAIPAVFGWADLPDLTLVLAWELQRRVADDAPLVLWYGMSDQQERRWPADYDIARMGLTDVHVTGTKLSWERVVDLADVVVLPTGAIEPLPAGFPATAAEFGAHLACWEGHADAGAVARAGGTVARRGDVGAMADQVVELLRAAGSVPPVDASTRMSAGWLERLAPLELAPR